MIEKHGPPVAVELATANCAERLATLRAEIGKGLDDIAAGRIVDGTDAFEALRKSLA